MIEPGYWVFEVPLGVWSANHREHWRVEAERVKEMRGLSCILARRSGIPKLTVVQVEAWPLGKTNYDCGNAYPAVKAAQDGLVDAGILPNDGPKNVRRLTMHPTIPARLEGLRLLIIDASDFPD